MRLAHPSSGPPRRGVILLLVVLMLALFLVVGLAFVLYSESAATGSRIYVEAQTPDIADVPPETLLSWALGQLIYPVPDDISGAESAMRGHELGRLEYGWHPVPSASNPLVADPTHTNNPWDATPDPTIPGGKVTYGNYANTTPFNGLGPLRSLQSPFNGFSEYNMVNYTYFAADGFVRDPERIGLRSNLNAALTPFAGGFNAPYTYPDRVNMFLAAVQASKVIAPARAGQPAVTGPALLMPSYFRPTAVPGLGTMGTLLTTTGGGNASSFWTTNQPAYKYLTLRPRPADQLLAGETWPPNRPYFPLPADPGGDVKNLPGVSWYNSLTAVNQPYQNDSFWMDLGYPVQISRNGKKFKPLFAFLVLDLDGRINLNIAGNTNAIATNNGVQSAAHASNQAVGRHEINLSAVLPAASITSATTPEWPQLFTGSVVTPSYVGRYGLDKTPGSAPLGANNAIADPYGPDSTNGQMLRSLIFPVDFDAVDMANNRAVTTKFLLPLSPNAQGQPSFESYPQFSTTGYDNYTATQAALNPRVNHPLLDQKLRAFGDDQPFGDDNMYWLLANDYHKSYLYNLIPNNLGGPSAISSPLGPQVRQLITTRSFELDAPGIPPWVTSSQASAYQYTAAQNSLTPSVINSTAGNYPTGQPMVTPTPGTAPNQMDGLATTAAASNDYSDFKAGDGRANILGRVDLNRKLTPYYDAKGLFNGGQAIPAPVPASSLIPGLLSIHPEYRYYVATNDRQQLAQDIFNRLVQATGAMNPDSVGPPAKLGSLHQKSGATATNYNATRWLAQLAVNIVDYVDDDDIMTPFNWNPSPDTAIANGDTGWVYGVEAPNLVVNEVYCEVANDPTDTTAANSGAKLPYQYSFWLELYNPMTAPVSPTTNQPTAISKTNQTTADRQDPNKTSPLFPAAGQDRLAVQLQRQSATVGTYPVYQIQIVNETGPNSSPPTWLAQPNNTDGSIGVTQAVTIDVTSYNPDFGAQAGAPANSPMPYPDYTFVQPNIGAFNIPTAAGANAIPNNTGFYVMGPDSKHPFAQPQQNPGGQGGITLRPTMNLLDQGQAPQQSSTAPWGQPTGATAKNALTYAYPQGPSTTPQSTEAARTHTVLLRRLACPNLSPNPLVKGAGGIVAPLIPTMPPNPYVTVDYMSGVPTNDAVQYTSQKPLPANVPNNPDPVAKNPAQHYSIGRVQPYNAAVTKKQQSGAPNPIANTFFSHNSQTPPPGPMSASTNNQAQVTLDFPFDWLTFADRPLTNVMEVLNVPTTYPHMLTHAFGYNPATKQRDLTNHLAPWGIQDARIYRALEYFTVGDRHPYPGTLGRVAGKVNVNTVFDEPIVTALADPQTNSNWFTVQAIQDVWQGNGNLADTNNNSFLNRKQQLLALSGASQLDKPFMSLAAPPVSINSDPQYPNGSGIANTIAPYPVTVNKAAQPGGTFTPQTTTTAPTPVSINYTTPSGSQIPPYVINELLTKATGHTTNRSNTFAVFLTVGFFEVIDDTTLPVKLGAELTTAGGKNLRHQMFSIVDRTNLAIDAGPALDPFTPDPSGRLRQPPTPPTFLPLSDAIPAGAGAPPKAGQPATPITVTVVGGLLPNITPTQIGLPVDYDGNAPVTFKQLASAASAVLNPPNPVLPASPSEIAAGKCWRTYWPSGTYQWMFLDSGATQEPVQVTFVTQVTSNTIVTKLQLLFPNGAQFSHPPGAMLCTYQPGNPGPQGPINFNSPQYRAVVPYTYIIQ